MSRYHWKNEPPEDPDDWWTDPNGYEQDQEPQQQEVEKRPLRESARRRALFAKAEKALQVAAAVRGSQMPDKVVELWRRRNGLAGGLYIYVGPDHQLQWTPRGGFKVIEIDEIPF